MIEVLHRCNRRPMLLLANLLMLALPATVLGRDNQLSAAEQAAGWQLLFDGTSLTHWRSYGQSQVAPAWQVREGTLMLTQRGGGDLVSRASYDHFRLQLDWKISRNGNSGVFILADESELPIYVHAPEIQLLDDAGHPDNKLANHRSGSLYDMVAAPAAAQKPAGEWNRLFISHIDGHLHVWQNGVLAVDIHIGGERWQALLANSKFADWPGFGTLSGGQIGLQDHGDVVAFKNIKIQPLPGGGQR